MALTTTILQKLRSAYGEDAAVIKVTGDASYPTGGYAITPVMFGFNSFATDGLGTGLPPVNGNWSLLGDATGTPNAIYGAINPVNGNLQLFVTTTGVEVGSGVSATGYSGVLEALGH